jgi:arylsulfatase A-like enzyme
MASNEDAEKSNLTRKDFLKVAGAGLAGAALLGTSAPSAGCSYRPNGDSRMSVVLVIIDSLRKDHVGAYGESKAKTPNLDAFAKESLRFDRAYPESLPTICARRAIHTGLRTWPFRNWEPAEGDTVPLYGWQPIPENQTTLAEILRRSGYGTLFVTDAHPQFRPSYNFHRGFDAYHFVRGQETDHDKPVWLCPEDKLESCLIAGPRQEKQRAVLRQYFANASDRRKEEDWGAPRVFAKAAEYLTVAREAQPFFLVVDSYDPHEPWDPPEEYVNLYADTYGGPEPFVPTYGGIDDLTDEQLGRMRALYAAEVTMVDRWLGRFLDKAEESGLMENILFVLLSDHGHALGEHGISGKPHYALWPEVTDIPFFLRHPEGKKAGEASDHYASTHDIAPTVLGSLGIEPAEPMDGQNLSVLFDGKAPEPRAHFTLGYHDHVWARDDRYVMFARNDGAEAKLFDAREDPAMNNNVAGEHPESVKRMFEEYVLKDAGDTLPNY